MLIFSVDSAEGDSGDETEIKESVTGGEAGDDENQLDLDPNSIGGYWLQRELVRTFFFFDLFAKNLSSPFHSALHPDYVTHLSG